MHTVEIPWVTRVFASARIDFLLPFTSRFELIHPIFGVNCTRNIPLLVEDILSFEFNVNSTVRRNEPRVPCEIGLFSESRRDFEIDGDLTDAKSTSPLRRYANQPSDLLVDQASPREWIRIATRCAFFGINVLPTRATFYSCTQAWSTLFPTWHPLTRFNTTLCALKATCAGFKSLHGQHV